MLGVTQYDISNKDAELLDVNLNDDAIKNALDRYRAADNTYPRLFTAIPCEVAEIHVITVF